MEATVRGFNHWHRFKPISIVIVSTACGKLTRIRVGFAAEVSGIIRQWPFSPASVRPDQFLGPSAAGTYLPKTRFAAAAALLGERLLVKNTLFWIDLTYLTEKVLCYDM